MGTYCNGATNKTGEPNDNNDANMFSVTPHKRHVSQVSTGIYFFYLEILFNFSKYLEILTRTIQMMKYCLLKVKMRIMSANKALMLKIKFVQVKKR